MSADEIQDKLNALDGEHNPSSVPDSGFGRYPDGTYVARIDKLYVDKSKAGNLQCVWDLEIIQGDYAARKLMKFSGMDSAQKLDFLTRDFRTVGIDNFKWSDVHNQFDKVLDKLVQIELKSKAKDGNVYQSIYIQKIVKPDDLMVSSALKEDVPF
jgi:hypothetical protein